jgi:hypothetical protein
LPVLFLVGFAHAIRFPWPKGKIAPSVRCTHISL